MVWLWCRLKLYDGKPGKYVFQLAFVWLNLLLFIFFVILADHGWKIS